MAYLLYHDMCIAERQLTSLFGKISKYPYYRLLSDYKTQKRKRDHCKTISAKPNIGKQVIFVNLLTTGLAVILRGLPVWTFPTNMTLSSFKLNELYNVSVHHNVDFTDLHHRPVACVVAAAVSSAFVSAAGPRRWMWPAHRSFCCLPLED